MIRLLVADDHPIVREGIKRLVAEVADMELVGEAANADQAFQLARETPADVILLDVSMPGPGFLETLSRLREQSPQLSVLVLSVHAEDQYAVRALRAGAAGYLTKDHSPEELADAVRRVHRGGKYVSATLAEKLASQLEESGERLPHELLSDREYQVLCGLGAGKAIKAIANELALSPKTVSTYRTRILEKMKFAHNADLVRYALQHGLVD